MTPQAQALAGGRDVRGADPAAIRPGARLRRDSGAGKRTGRVIARPTLRCHPSPATRRRNPAVRIDA
jgi:hypothetical protein